MTTKHTAGPWTCGKRGSFYENHIVANGTLIASVAGRHFNPAMSAEEIKANRDVIAAAPELLEALRYLVGADNDIQANRGNKSDQAMNRIAALDMAARAIAKATGADTPS